MLVFEDYRKTPKEVRQGILAIGNFDGMHAGHREIIAETMELARARGVLAGVMTFEPHPREIFRADDPPFRLTSRAQKLRLLEQSGLDFVHMQAFDDRFYKLTREAFIEDVLIGGLGVSHVVVGRNFLFGRNRAGTPDFLELSANAYGFDVSFCEEITDSRGITVSSSRIRHALREGNVEEATRLLGRPWTLEGQVVKGDRRGHKLGYPTANIRINSYLRPAYGVYAVRVEVEGTEARYDGVANLGIRPMFEIAEPILEAHLFNFAKDLYGKTLRVEIISRLREEMRFSSFEALTAQMDRDSIAAKKILSQPALVRS